MKKSMAAFNRLWLKAATLDFMITQLRHQLTRDCRIAVNLLCAYVY